MAARTHEAHKAGVAKDDPRVQTVHAWLNAQFDNGRQISVEWEEPAPIVARVFDMEHEKSAKRKSSLPSSVVNWAASFTSSLSVSALPGCHLHPGVQ